MGFGPDTRGLEGECGQVSAHVLRAVTGRGARETGHDSEGGDPALLGERQKAGPAEPADKGPGGRPLGGIFCVGRKLICGTAKSPSNPTTSICLLLIWAAFPYLKVSRGLPNIILKINGTHFSCLPKEVHRSSPSGLLVGSHVYFLPSLFPELRPAFRPHRDPPSSLQPAAESYSD